MRRPVDRVRAGAGGPGSGAGSRGEAPASRLPFTKWLMQFRGEATATGDLARQAARDPEWAEPASLAALESHLQGAGCSQATLEVARRAWRRYAGDAGPRPRA